MNGVRQREQRGLGDVVGGADAPGRVARRASRRTAPPCPARRARPMRRCRSRPVRCALTRIGASSTASDRVSVSAAPLVIATASVPASILNAATPENSRIDPPSSIWPAKARASISGPITLVSNERRTASRSRSSIRAAGARRGGRDEVVDGADPLGQRGDRRVVGEVDGLDADAGVGRVGLARGAPALRPATITFAPVGAGRLGDAARDPAAAADHQHGLVVQEAAMSSSLSLRRAGRRGRRRERPGAPREPGAGVAGRSTSAAASLAAAGHVSAQRLEVSRAGRLGRPRDHLGR